MTRRIEAGPVLVGLGALLLLVSVFLDWYDPNVTAWEAFEVLDLLMVVLSLAAIVAVVGTFAPSAAVIDRRSLPLIVAALAVIVASQILDPPPGVTGDPTTGAWLALGAVLAMAVGAVLTVVALFYYLLVAKQMYIDPPARPTPVPVGSALALVLLVSALAVVLLGLYPGPLVDAAMRAAAPLF